MFDFVILSKFKLMNFSIKRVLFKKYGFNISHTQFNFICPSCKKSEPEIKLTRDHILPLSMGGTDNIENIQPLCKKCNSKKHTRIIKY